MWEIGGRVDRLEEDRGWAWLLCRDGKIRSVCRPDGRNNSAISSKPACLLRRLLRPRPLVVGPAAFTCRVLELSGVVPSGELLAPGHDLPALSLQGRRLSFRPAQLIKS